jgi:hypothetical protein
MPVFEYKAMVRATGKTQRGVIDADNALPLRAASCAIWG